MGLENMLHKNFLFVVFLLSVASFVSPTEMSLRVSFTIDQSDNVVVKSVYLYDFEPDAYFGGPYSIQLVDSEGNIVSDFGFSVSFFIWDYPRKLEKMSYMFAVPYRETAQYLIIRHGEKILAKVDLDVLCDNDGKCELNENTLSCPSDCEVYAADSYCPGIADGICDPDCSGRFDADCPPVEVYVELGNETVKRLKINFSAPPPGFENVSNSSNVYLKREILRALPYVIIILLVILILRAVLKNIQGPPKSENSQKIKDKDGTDIKNTDPNEQQTNSNL